MTRKAHERRHLAGRSSSTAPSNDPTTPAASSRRGSTGRSGTGCASAGRLSTDGTPSSVGRARQGSGWSEAEDQLLRYEVAKRGSCNWKSIADVFPNKTAVQCLHRWRKVLDPQINKGPWTTEEDEKIRTLVTEVRLDDPTRPLKWSAIAKHLPGRLGKQCRERWHNQLDPSVKKGPWSDEEVHCPTFECQALRALCCCTDVSQPVGSRRSER